MKDAIVLGGVIAMLSAGCRAELPGGYYGCEDGNCPPGQVCDARDQRCYRVPSDLEPEPEPEPEPDAGDDAAVDAGGP